MFIIKFKVITNLLPILDTISESITYACKNPDGTAEILIKKDCPDAIDKIISCIQADEDVSESLINQILSLKESLINISSFDTNFAALQPLVQDIKQKISELPYKINVTFFPHQGSTWGSLESVWQAFLSDPHCDTKIVLTPTLRNTPTGMKTLYDDYLTPKGIPFIPYNQYDLETDRPDISFSANPYDSTCLPQFTPQNLQKNSTALVYIPYYIESGVMEADLSTHYNMFMHNNAWVVVCQSESVKKKYEMYSSAQGKNIMALGAPKMDVLLKINKENPNIPDEWVKKANGKKVLLYNTHFTISPFKAIERINQMYELFSTNEWGEIILLWRPHPMTRTVYSGFHPESYDQWCAAADKLCALDNVILDENSSYDAAFCLSDGLYSDLSSIAVEYMVTGKPVLMNNFTNNIDYKFMTLDISSFYLTSNTWPKLKNKLKAFKRVLITGEDPKKELRMKALNEGIANLDGKAGEHIKDALLNSFLTQHLT